MALLHHDVGDARLVLLLQADAGLPNCEQLVVQHLGGKHTALPSLCRRSNDETSLKVTGCMRTNTVIYLIKNASVRAAPTLQQAANKAVQYKCWGVPFEAGLAFSKSLAGRLEYSQPIRVTSFHLTKDAAMFIN